MNGGVDPDEIVDSTVQVHDWATLVQLQDIMTAQYDHCLAIVNDEIMMAFGGGTTAVYKYNRTIE